MTRWLEWWRWNDVLYVCDIPHHQITCGYIARIVHRGTYKAQRMRGHPFLFHELPAGVFSVSCGIPRRDMKSRVVRIILVKQLLSLPSLRCSPQIYFSRDPRTSATTPSSAFQGIIECTFLLVTKLFLALEPVLWGFARLFGRRHPSQYYCQ